VEEVKKKKEEHSMEALLLVNPLLDGGLIVLFRLWELPDFV